MTEGTGGPAVARTWHDARLLWPARIALGLGALLTALIAFRGPIESNEQWDHVAAAALMTAAWVAASIWLVRVQTALLKARAPLRYEYPGSGLWIMWIVPLVSAIIAGVRLAQFDSAARAVVRLDGEPDPWTGQLWQVVPWGVAWFLVTTMYLTNARLVSPWEAAAPKVVAVVAYALWVYIVLRLTRNTRVAAARAAQTA